MITKFLKQNSYLKWRELYFFEKISSILPWLIFLSLLFIVILYKVVYYLNFELATFWYLYSMLAGIFLLSRLPLAYLQKGSLDQPLEGNANFEYPDISIIIAAKDEEVSIFNTISACMDTDYPAQIECIAVDDGSTDGTLAEMEKAKATFGTDKIIVVSFEHNRGKREAMSEGLLLSKNDIVVFVDSDSFLNRDSLRNLIQQFSDPEVGAISGFTGVANHTTNLLTKMQSIRYAISFDIFKSAESYFGTVTCCPGCFSAYHKKAVMPVLSKWRNQMFLGTRSTFGDDRSLTNFVLKNWKVVYTEKAKAITIVPDRYMKFLKQQLRWKKSWVREGFVASSFMWKKHPIAALSFYINLILPTLGPVVVGWVLFMTIFNQSPQFLVIFLSGVVTMGMLFGAYLSITQKEKYWLYMPLFSILYTLIMIWQMPYAVLTLRKTHWGTR